MAALLYVLGPLALAVVVYLVRRRKKAAKLHDPHRTLKFYDKQMRQYTALRSEAAESERRAISAELEAIDLRSQLAALERAQLEKDSENARLNRDLLERWDQIEEQGRDLAHYREQDTVSEL